jgi:acetolactate synthase small subunit|tara:strand:- start:3271 stop:4830 length:1560 start_codon:yes stop_codon:yes gene_type:complete
MKNNIKVYDIEKDCGLEETIQAQSSIAFTSELVLQETKDKVPYNNLDAFSTSSIDDPDLFHVYSVLVSTVWNRNDDIFNKEEVWAARDTPKFKPTNLEHDEKQMVGGIIESWPVDKDFNLIAADTNIEDIPEEYHILVSSVIYRQWQDPELRSRAEQLISEIEDGTKYVSMECIFKGFDYGVVDLEGKNHVIARNDNTAFLSQHLRSYGGEGIYQGHKLGRVLRNITFSGKGFVERPANPDSIIFDKDHTFSFANAKTSKSVFFNKNGVTNNTTEKQLSSEVNISIKGNTMSNEILSDQVKDLKEALAAIEAENKDLNDKLAQANVSAYENKVQELESTVAEFETKIQDLDSQLSEANDSKEKIELEMNTKSEELDSLKAEMHKMHEEKKKKDRKDKMVMAGLTEDEAEAKIEVFANLDEESFEAFIETVADMHKKKKKEEEDSEADMHYDDEKKKKKEDESKAAEEADEELVEETEAAELVEEVTEEGDVAVSSETEETEMSTARAGLGQWVESIITK